MSTDFADIERVFNCDVSKGLALCNEYLCSKEFPTIELVRKHFRELSSCNLCMESWEKPTYAVHCITCSKDYSSCFCLNCFLNGKHRNHKAFIATSDQGNCDCGFGIIADPRYFCDKHQKMKISYKDLFTGEEIMKITNIVKLALKNITFLSSFDTRSTKLIFSYLQDLALLSTPVTDLIADLFIENFNVAQYTLDCGKFTKDSIEAYKKILGTLVNSVSFKKYFTKSIIGVFAEFSNIAVKLGSDPRFVIQFAPLSQFYQMQYTFFHAFHGPEISLCANECDWVSAFSDSLQSIIGISKKYEANQKTLNFIAFSIMQKLRILIECVTKIDGQHASIEKAAFAFASVITPIEGFMKIDGKYMNFDDGYGDSQLFKFINSINLMIKLFGKSKCYVPSAYKYFLNGIMQSLVNDSIDEPSDTISFFRPVFNAGVKTPISFGLHIIAWQNLMSHRDIANEFQRLSVENEIYCDDLAVFWSLVPLRYLAIAEFCQMNSFRYNWSNISDMINEDMKLANSWLRFIPSFLIVQTMLGLSTQKGTFLAMIIHTFGMLSNSVAQKEKKNIEFCVFFLISCLILDRTAAKSDKRTMRKQLLMSLLANRNMKIDDILDMISFKMRHDEEFIQDFLSYARKAPGKADASFELYNSIGWHCVLPWVSAQCIRDVCRKKIKSAPDKLLPFPDFTEEFPSELDLKSVLYSPVLYALIFQALSNQIYVPELTYVQTLHFALNLLILEAKNYNKEQKTEFDSEKVYVAETFDDMFSILPNDFQQFIHSKIAFLGRDATTVLQMLEVLGDISVTVFNVLDPNRTTLPLSPNAKMLKRKAATKAKEAALSKINNEPLTMKTHIYDKPCFDACSSCGKGNDLMLPVFAYKTAIPSFVGLSLPKVVVSLSGDPHAVHEHCIGDHIFKCNSCGALNNCLLPMDPTLETATAFLSCAFGEKRAIENCVHTIAYELHVLELRYRMNPFALDNCVSKPLLSRVFKCYTICKNEKLKSVSEDPVAQLILSIDAKTTAENFFSFVAASAAQQKDNISKYIFLRCARIMSVYFFDQKHDDWEDDLQLPSLIRFFKIEAFEADEPQIFMFPSVTESFIMMLERLTEEQRRNINGTAIDLFTGQVFTSKDNDDGSTLCTKTHIAKNCGATYSVFMLLASPWTRVLIETAAGEKVSLKPIYLDQFGMDDAFLKRESLMSLSRTRCFYVLDLILSGRWTQNLEKVF